MADVDSGFAELEGYVTSMLSALEGAEQRRLMSIIAQAMRRSQQRRIAAQKNPDGSRFAKRKAPPPDRQNDPIKFLYPAGGVGRPRIVIMHSWKKMGEDRFIGFDRRAGGIRTFFRSNIIRYLGADERDGQGRDGKLNRRRIRQQAMFRKIRTARYLKAGQRPNEAWVGFVGMIGDIASVHQFGGKDRPSPKTEPVDYPARELLGMTEKDRADLLDAVEKHLMG